MLPVVLICLDGMGPDYVDDALARGLWPNVAAWVRGPAARGYYGVGDGILPSFTNPNNLSIVSGLSAAGHGLCGNHYFDRMIGREVAADDARCLRAETTLARLEREGARIATVTSKEKLRRLLGAGREGPSFSAERADTQGHAGWGIERFDRFVGEDAPPIYSAAASTFVLRAGVALLREQRLDVLYLSTTDYLQHRYAPGDAALEPFLVELDRCFGELRALGAVVAITADHGMNAKPRVVYLGELFPGARIVLPITDPYVKHHGALGGCAYIDCDAPQRVLDALRGHAGIEAALLREEAAARYELPADRIGDVVVFAAADTALGKTPAEHDLSALDGPLRSHGGPAEQRVPLILSDAPRGAPPARSRDLLASALRLRRP